jgi:hypothetical protein
VRAPTVREEASCPPPASPIPVVIGDFAPARVARLADEVSYAAGSIVSRIITKWHVPHAVRAHDTVEDAALDGAKRAVKDASP